MSRFGEGIRTALTNIGISLSCYTGHSCGIEAASSAAQAGLPDSLIQTLACWRSSAIQLYRRTPTLLSSSFLKQTFPVTDSRQLVVTSSSVIMYLLHVSMADPGRFFGCLSAPPPLSPKSKNVYISHPSVSEAEDAP